MAASADRGARKRPQKPQTLSDMPAQAAAERAVLVAARARARATNSAAPASPRPAAHAQPAPLVYRHCRSCAAGDGEEGHRADRQEPPRSRPPGNGGLPLANSTMTSRAGVAPSDVGHGQRP